MMTLAQASSYFDRMQVTDAYTDAPLFRGQIDPYDDSKRDASSAYRRILSVSPDAAVPAHGCVKFFGRAWILGEDSVDGLGETHRKKYVAQRADNKFSAGTATEFLLGTSKPSVWGFPAWVKDAKQVAESSRVANLYEMLMPLGTLVQPRQVLWAPGVAFLTLSVRDLPSYFLGVNCLKLDSPTPLPVTLRSRTYDPALGDYTLAAQADTQGFRVRWESLFQYDAQLEARYQEGDFSLVLPLGTAVDTSTLVTFEGVNLSVLAVDDLPGMVVAHVRRT